MEDVFEPMQAIELHVCSVYVRYLNIFFERRVTERRVLSRAELSIIKLLQLIAYIRT